MHMIPRCIAAMGPEFGCDFVTERETFYEHFIVYGNRGRDWGKEKRVKRFSLIPFNLWLNER